MTSHSGRNPRGGMGLTQQACVGATSFLSQRYSPQANATSGVALKAPIGSLPYASWIYLVQRRFWAEGRRCDLVGVEHGSQEGCVHGKCLIGLILGLIPWPRGPDSGSAASLVLSLQFGGHRPEEAIGEAGASQQSCPCAWEAPARSNAALDTARSACSSTA